MEYLIKDASKKLNISIYTLRYYDKEGLTPFVRKDENGVRKYTEEDLEWIRMLINLRDIDMPISNIKEYIDLYLKGDETIAERRELMCKYREYIKKKIRDTINSLEMATQKLRQYDYAVADILDDENMFQINKKYK
ncbi:MerR family transcriptional regulator [uncultured Clostridium sp.]|uniref:MerR family transcriptional regulator n=1 Tax=uncultured Clostridium sp. TaxID=59620 RepID=UPI0025FE1885|nr:MerR family transcriptional regulator [uncultured Clostridium sp.]